MLFCPLNGFERAVLGQRSNKKGREKKSFSSSFIYFRTRIFKKTDLQCISTVAHKIIMLNIWYLLYKFAYDLRVVFLHESRLTRNTGSSSERCHMIK